MFNFIKRMYIAGQFTKTDIEQFVEKALLTIEEASLILANEI